MFPSLFDYIHRYRRPHRIANLSLTSHKFLIRSVRRRCCRFLCSVVRFFLSLLLLRRFAITCWCRLSLLYICMCLDNLLFIFEIRKAHDRAQSHTITRTQTAQSVAISFRVCLFKSRMKLKRTLWIYWLGPEILFRVSVFFLQRWADDDCDETINIQASSGTSALV